MLDVRQLRSFVMVAQERHFTRAADRLHIAQSALSLQIKTLEASLGARLLNRGKRAAVTLTDAGETFLQEAVAALRQLERADRVGRMAGRGEIGQVELGYVLSAATCGLLPSILGGFRLSHPSVLVRVETMPTPRQLAAVEDGRIDVALVRPRPAYPTAVVARLIHREPLMLAMPVDHRLAAGPIRAADLAGETFIIPQFDDVSGFAPHLAALERRIGAPVEGARHVGDVVTGLSLAAAGCGLALVPSSMQAIGLAGLIFKPVEGYEETVELALAWRRGEKAPSTLAFIEAALAAAGDAPAA